MVKDIQYKTFGELRQELLEYCRIISNDNDFNDNISCGGIMSEIIKVMNDPSINLSKLSETDKEVSKLISLASELEGEEFDGQKKMLGDISAIISYMTINFNDERLAA